MSSKLTLGFIFARCVYLALGAQKTQPSTLATSPRIRKVTVGPGVV